MFVAMPREVKRRKRGRNEDEIREKLELLSCSQKKNLGYISRDVEVIVCVCVCVHALARTRVSHASLPRRTRTVPCLCHPRLRFSSASFFLLFSGSFLIAFQRSEDELSLVSPSTFPAPIYIVDCH